MSRSQVSMPCNPRWGRCFAGRKRRNAEQVIEFKMQSRNRREFEIDPDEYRGENCHEHGFCIKNGICLMRSHTNILRQAEIHGIAAKKICLPQKPPTHGKQCWISGWNPNGKKRTEIEMNLFDIPEDSPEDTSKNQWCIDHSLYTREPSEDEPSDDQSSQDETAQDETTQDETAQDETTQDELYQDEPSQEGEGSFVKSPSENPLREIVHSVKQKIF